MKTNQKCYWCGKDAKTREHVPPKCFFPEKYEIDGKIIKPNWSKLITVPSCEEHNNHKSNLDEYLLTHIVPFVDKNNPYATALASSNLYRAILRNKHLLQPNRFDGKNLFFNANDHNLGYSFEALARALYYHEYSCCFIGICYVFFGAYSTSSALYERNRAVIELVKKEIPIWNTTLKGEYPEIFKYQFSPTDDVGCTSLLVTFYESIDVVIVFVDEKCKTKRERANFFPIAATLINPFLFHGYQGYNSPKREEE